MKKFVSLVISLILMIAFSALAIQKHASARNDEVKLKVFVHYPNPHGKPAAVSSCTPTTNDQVADYGLAGWHMPTSGATYKINYSTKPSNLNNTQVYNAVSTSFVTWTTADAKQIFQYGGATTAQNAKYDGTNAILWKPITRSAIAITYVWYYTSSGQLAESDTVFNKIYKWSYTPYNGTNDCGGISGTYDLQNIGTHEFGHWIGLDDLYNTIDKDLTMYGYGEVAELKKDTLGQGDILGVNNIQP